MRTSETPEGPTGSHVAIDISVQTRYSSLSAERGVGLGGEGADFPGERLGLWLTLGALDERTVAVDSPAALAASAGGDVACFRRQCETKEAEMIAGAQPEPIIPVSDLDTAAQFYGDTLGLRELERYDDPAANPMIRYGVGEGSVLVYKSVGAGQSRHTVAGFIVADIEAAVDDLRQRGVTLEEYDTGDISTAGGIATIATARVAWFKDPDGNILAVGQYA
jgi:catechol 2,3-dioxygenase-like lactoylglutathione lyase family enzyme